MQRIFFIRRVTAMSLYHRFDDENGVDSDDVRRFMHSKAKHIVLPMLAAALLVVPVSTPHLLKQGEEYEDLACNFVNNLIVAHSQCHRG